MKIKKILLVLPFFIYSAIIFWISHQPKVEILEDSFIGFDKILHFFAYFIYSILTFTAIEIIINFKFKSGIFAIFVALLFAISDEYHQSFIDGRDASVYDFLADAVGIILSGIFFSKIRKLLKKYLNGKQI